MQSIVGISHCYLFILKIDFILYLKGNIMGTVIDILIANKAKELLSECKEVKVVKNKGIIGDRYFYGLGSFSQRLKDKHDFHITLIEKEEIDSFNQLTGLNYSNAKFRRNLVTEGIKLNDLLGKKFEINGVLLFGMRLCEPCKMLADDIGKEFLVSMVHKAGLRAKVLESGDVKIGDTINYD